MSEPDWKDKDSTKRWLEQKFVGSAKKGSPLYQYLISLGRKTDGREVHLSTHELVRWLRANKINSAVHYPAELDSMIFYPEYKYPMFLLDKKHQHSTKRDQTSFKAHGRTPQLQTKSGRAGKSKPSRQRTTNNQPKNISPSKAILKSTGRQSKGAKQTDPKAPRQLEAQVRILRSETAKRKQGKTGKAQCELGDASASNTSTMQISFA
ncbi:MAG: hypothetical protein Q9164_006173 [Protoblastenia rupestris]